MRRIGLVILAALGLAALVAATATAHSTPQIRAAQEHARQVKAEVDRIGMQLEMTQHKYEGAEIKLKETNAKLASNTVRLHVARKNFHAAQQRIMERIYSLYVNGNPSTLDVIAGAKSLSQVIDRAEAAQAISQQDTALGLEALHFENAVQTRQQSLKTLRARRAKTVLTLAAEKQRIAAAQAQQEHLLASIHLSIHKLQEQEAALERQQRAAALERLREIAAAKAAAAAQGTGLPQVPPIVGGNGLGHPEAARIALGYLGVPYVWGGASPSGFDCSGLVMYVYAQLGISLPHYTVSQWNATIPISMSQLQPGDLIFFNGLSHVGMYIGNNQMVNAPHPGSVVRIDNIYGFGSIDGARRVG